MERNPVDRRLTTEQAELLKVQAGQVFTPRTPISNRELFAGRGGEIQRLMDAVNEVGLHVVLYGERGVGKTSLANVIPILFQVFDEKFDPPRTTPRIAVRGNASKADTFSTVWAKVFDEIFWSAESPTIGYLAKPQSETVTLRQAFGLDDRELGIENIRRLLTSLPGSVFVIDEFDRLPAKHASQFSDLIKSLADHAVDTTIMLVGVADSIDGLVRDHASIPRALIQVRLAPMKIRELREILQNAEKKLAIVFEQAAGERIAFLSQGRPHYTHFVGLLSARAAFDRRSGVVRMEDVTKGLEKAVQSADHTISRLYDDATYSSHADALWKPVLFACAIAAATRSDPNGYYSPVDVVAPLSEILKRPVKISTFNGHLAEYCDDRRGVLQRTGHARAYRYRFRDPLVPPYVLMRGIAEQSVSADVLERLMGASALPIVQ